MGDQGMSMCGCVWVWWEERESQEEYMGDQGMCGCGCGVHVVWEWRERRYGGLRGMCVSVVGGGERRNVRGIRVSEVLHQGEDTTTFSNCHHSRSILCSVSAIAYL